MAYGDRDRDGFATYPLMRGVTVEGNLTDDVKLRTGEGYAFFSGALVGESRFDKKQEEATTILVSFTINENQAQMLEEEGLRGKRLSITGDLYLDTYDGRLQFKMRATGVNKALRWAPKGEGAGRRSGGDSDRSERAPRDREERSSARRSSEDEGRSGGRDRGERAPRDRAPRESRAPRDAGDVDDEY